MDRSIRNRGCYRFGRFRLDAAARRLTCDGEIVVLTPTVFDLLHYLVEHAGRVVSKDELFEAVWPGRYLDESNLTTSIFVLRRALKSAGESERLIETAPGRGYAFVADVVVDPAQAFMRAGGRSPTLPASDRRAGRLHSHGVSWRFGKAWVAGCICLGAVLVAAAWFTVSSVVSPNAPKHRYAVVVANVSNLTRDPAIGVALTTAQIIDLGRVPVLDVLAAAPIRSTLERMRRSPDQVLSPALAREVCRRSAAFAVVEGEVSMVGPKYLLALRATDCAGGATLVAEKAEADTRETLLTAWDRLADAVGRGLGDALPSVHRPALRLLPETTPSLQALEAYSKARPLIDQGRYDDAAELLVHAVTLDPTFAIAHADLAFLDSLHHSRDSGADAEIRKAYALRGAADDRERLYIDSLEDLIVAGDFEAEIADLRRWTGAYADDPTPWMMLATTQMQMSRFPEAIVAGRRAIALDPTSAPAYFKLALVYLRAHDPTRMDDVCREAVSRGLDSDDIHVLILRAALWRSDSATVDQQMSLMHGRQGESQAWGARGMDAFGRGRIRQGESFFDRMDEVHLDMPTQDEDSAPIARWEADLGYPERARVRLRRIAATRDLSYIVALAAAGDDASAEARLRQARPRAIHDTMFVDAVTPQVRAIRDLRQGRPRDAVAALRGSSPFAIRGPDILYLRGRAELAAGDGVAAEAEFRRILGPDGLTPLFPRYPESGLATLGLARAYRLQGGLRQSEQAYRAFLADWRDADPDEPILLAARAEAAAVRAEASRQVAKSERGGGLGS